ncbi:uncharacterized protein F5891DRAFT_1180757 [Suillus fuscotomentosus]|uniref:Uncharacterized protein n=1 Tax=Suillus fuscotomentosus TaxID=1912939 RepID=A0AAD4EKE6_9AGAM|nr:uncharacterized protein F5891DRAFT_1180757 [Suillus fuscotomentosus]KAG1907731.1 hypothetical protein F5891DRAFT_1180757 [Suillus fuscotomentosus]
MANKDYYGGQQQQYYPPQGPPPGQGGYYPQQPQQSYGGQPYGQSYGGPGYQPQPPPQTVYVSVHNPAHNNLLSPVVLVEALAAWLVSLVHVFAAVPRRHFATVYFDENPLMITLYMSAGCLYATMDTNLYFLSLVMSHPDFYSLDYDTVLRDSVVSE